MKKQQVQSSRPQKKDVQVLLGGKRIRVSGSALTPVRSTATCGEFQKKRKPR